MWYILRLRINWSIFVLCCTCRQNYDLLILISASGKEDLDLGPNDLHLDDFLLSGKFDLIAYTDPELNLEDKKDMFNEELDLGEPVEEKEGGTSRKSEGHTHPPDQLKQEAKDAVKTEGGSGPSAVQHPALSPGAEATGSSTLISKVCVYQF